MTKTMWTNLAWMSEATPADWAAVIQAADVLYGRMAAQDLWEKSPLPQMVLDTQGEASEGPHLDGDEVVQFLIDCTTTTGKSDDRVGAADLLAAYKAWSVETNRAPLADRSFYLAISNMSDRWRHPETQNPFRRIKSGGRFALIGISMKPR